MDEAVDKLKTEVNLEKSLNTLLKHLVRVHLEVTKRMKDIRKKNIQLCNEEVVRQEVKLGELRNMIGNVFVVIYDPRRKGKLRQLANILLNIKIQLENEVTRLLMIPEGKTKTVRESECEQNCNTLPETQIFFRTVHSEVYQ